MSGKVYFDTLVEMAEFLKAFAGNTAVFEAYRANDGRWVIEFNGGY